MAAVIPGRRTALWLDISEKTLGRPGWVENRSASEMARQRPRPPAGSIPRNRNCMFIGGDAWILLPRQAEAAQAAFEPPTGGTGGGFGGVPLPDVDAAPGVKAVPMFKADSVDWATPHLALVPSGYPAFQKDVPAGTTTSPSLPADVTAYPPPVEELELPQMYPVERIIRGKYLYPENTPWQLRMETPGQWEGGDVQHRFYYGGMTETDPGGKGGAFCVDFRGGGKAVVRERDSTVLTGDPWVKRFEFGYAEPSAGSRYLDTVSIIPHGKNRTGFYALSSEVFPGVFSGFGAIATMALASFGKLDPYVYRDLQPETRHYHLRAATGPGTWRMDQRADLRTKFSVIRMRYPSVDLDTDIGVLFDSPFHVPYPLPDFTAMRLSVDSYLMPGTSVTGVIYDASLNTPLTTEAITGYFLSNPGQQNYYVVLQLASQDGIQTPVVWGYSVRVAGDYRINVREPVRIDIEEVHLEGPDIDPSHEEGTVVVRDIRDQAEMLRRRDRIRGTISLHDAALFDPEDPAAGLITHLMEGETLSPEGDWRGKPGSVHPDPQWRDYTSLRLVGMWARCSDQLSLKLDNFGKDEQAADISPGVKPPWKVTAAIRHLFNNLGFDDDELDIPDLPIRFWTNIYYEVNAADFQLAAGVDPAGAIRKLAWDYLGMVLVRDANAGPRGLWRLVLNPAPPYQNLLLGLRIEPPAVGEPGAAGEGPILSHVSAAYGPSTTYAMTWRSWVRAPEVNVVVMQGCTADKEGNPIEKFVSTLINLNSIENPDHPDYLGRPVVVVFPVNPGLPSQAATDWACRRVYDESAHIKKYFEAQMPLFLVQDPLDALQVRLRLLRINDLLAVGGETLGWLPAMVRTCKPDYSSDRTQIQVLQGVILSDNEVEWSPPAVRRGRGH